MATSKRPLSQVEWLRTRLENGYVENAITMEREGSIRNHGGRIADLRDIYEREGKGRDYIKTYMRPVINKRTKRRTEVAEYYIPEKVTKFQMWKHGIKTK